MGDKGTAQQVWDVTESFYDEVVEACKTLYIESLKDLPPDVREAVKKAYENETHEVAKSILGTMLKNITVSDENKLLICQDTGIPVYFVKIGNNVRLDGYRLEQAIRKGTERATLEHPLRSSIVHPITRINNGNNLGFRVPVIHWEFVEGDEVEILMLPKGSGSENMSFMKTLIPAEGLKGVKKFILDCVFDSGANPCPPTIVGVGIGGTSDLCMALAKKATARPVGQPNPDPEIAKLEQEMLDAINELGIGANGLGGNSTALAVHIEYAHTHMTMNPVAVNMMCWPARRMRAIFKPGQAVEITH